MIEKPLKKVKIEVDNAIEEAKEIAEYCIRCGMCRRLCPVLRIGREEHYSPRGKLIMIDNNLFEKNVYNCTLCRACEKECPVGLRLCTAFVRAREVLVARNKENANLSEIVKNINRSGNIYGIKE